jgi:hypothetical protein
LHSLIRFSGGSYTNHCRFACWASGQWLVGAATGFIHAIFPKLFPDVHEGIALELGGLIINRRKLRNLLAQEKIAKAKAVEGTEKKEVSGDNNGATPADEVALINPDSCSDYLSEDYAKRFERAARAADRAKDIGDADSRHRDDGSLLAQERIKVQIGPGKSKKFL